MNLDMGHTGNTTGQLRNQPADGEDLALYDLGGIAGRR
jgi:hypothetical protein